MTSPSNRENTRTKDSQASGQQEDSDKVEPSKDSNGAIEQQRSPTSTKDDEAISMPQPNISPMGKEEDVDARPSDAHQPSSKKRRSSIQLIKDENVDDQSCSDDDLDDAGDIHEPFQRASKEILKGRRIIKTSRKWASVDTESGGSSTGTFSGLKLLADKSKAAADIETVTPIFGSSAAVPSFGSAAVSFFPSSGKTEGNSINGFGPSIACSSENTIDNALAPISSTFGKGFGAVSSGFNAMKSWSSTSTSGFAANTRNGEPKASDSAATVNGSTETFPASTSYNDIMTPASFPTLPVVDVANGEENEECLCQVRAKLFKLSPVAEEEGETLDDSLGELVPSVPSTSGRMEFQQDENKNDESSKHEITNGKNMKVDWHEAGIGPVRVLRYRVSPLVTEDSDTTIQIEGDKPHARIVQRRESVPGGHGTKLILNVRLIPNVCRVHRKADKCVQLDAPTHDDKESGRTLESYLFRFKTIAEADTLQTNLEKMLAP